jgi:MarR family transcriptional regulator, 2-MHQ and catechol-resistance regulon repressor
MPLELGDPLAHRALQALLRADSAVRRRLAAEVEREGVSAAGFSALVLTIAGGALELKTLRRRLGWSKANATRSRPRSRRSGSCCAGARPVTAAS